MGEAQGTGLAGRAAQEREDAEHDAGDADQGEQGEQGEKIPHPSLVNGGKGGDTVTTG